MRIETPCVREDISVHSSLVGGSTAYLRLRCNASIVEERKAPPEKWSPWAAAGTALHTIVERAINDNMKYFDVLAQFTGVEMENVVVTEQMIRDKVLPAVNFFDETVSESTSFDVEVKVSLGRPCEDEHSSVVFPVIEGAFGTADVVFVASDVFGVIDWKFGDGYIVDADDNDQGRFYLCGAIQQGLIPLRDEYVFWIFQPAAKLKPAQYASKGIYTIDDLKDFATRLHAAITGPTIYSAGEHCARCKGKLTCRAHADMLTTAVGTDVPGMDTSELAEALARVPSIKKWCDEVQKSALRNAQNGLSIPGWVLEPAIGNRTYVDEDAACLALGRLGLPADVRIVKKCLSAPKALEALEDIFTPQKSIDRFERKYVFRPENGQRLRKAKPGECDASSLARMTTALKARGF